MTQKAWGLAEATFNTPLAFAATDAFDYVELKIEPDQKYVDRISHVGTSTFQGAIKGKADNKWSAKCYMAPAAAGTAPDIGFMLKHAFGAETVSGGVSVTYSFSDTVPLSMQLVQYANGILKQANGAWIEEAVFTIAGGEICMVEFSGGFAEYGMLLPGATVNGIHTAPDTTILLTAGHARLMRPNIYVKFGPSGSYEDNSAAGYLITDVNYTTHIVTISPTLAGDLADLDAVVPNIPSSTVAGTQLGGIACALTLGGTSCVFNKGVTTIDTGVRGLMDAATSDVATQLVRNARKVEGELEFHLDTDVAPFIGGAWNGNLLAVVQRFGSATSPLATMTAPNARILVSQGPEMTDEALEIKASWRAQQSAAAADELALVFT
jgi:hypothetical protein